MIHTGKSSDFLEFAVLCDRVNAHALLNYDIYQFLPIDQASALE